MRCFLTLSALALGVVPAGVAQAGGEAGGWRVDTRLSLAASTTSDSTALAPASDGILGSGSLVLSHEHTFDSGLTYTWRGELRVERDAPSRPGFGGVLGACPANNVTCPRAPDGVFFATPVSPATGIAPDGVVVDSDLFARLEGASLSIEGPWGEGVVGLDAGVASRLDARPPTLLQRVSASSPSLDPTGLVVTRARNDPTGPSAKLSYMSPRWVGLRLGASFTPKADLHGADFNPDFSGPGLKNAELENVFEGAVSYAPGRLSLQQLADLDVNVRAGLTYTIARSAAFAPGFGDYSAVGAGIEIQKDDWTGGFRWLSSNNAWDSGEGDYVAWEAGLIHQRGEWRFGIETGWSHDQLSGLKGLSWLTGASHTLNQHVELGLAWVSSQADVPVLLASGSGHTNASNDGVVFEITVRN